MAFLDFDVVKLLEEELPRHFGGTATDYQLVETEDFNGEPELHLLIHPDVGVLDNDRIEQFFFNTLSRGFGVQRVMGIAWRDANILKIERRAPLTTASGKILHLHVLKSDFK
jgi:hypothetical protein